MSFSRCFRISSYCLIAAGFLSVAATQRIHPAAVILFAVIFFGSWFADTALIRKRAPAWALNCLALAYVPFFLWDARFLSRSFLIAAIHFLIFASSVKLLTLSKDRDYLPLYVISLAEIIAASALTVNLVFGACLLAFLLSGINTAVLFEMRSSNAEMKVAAGVQPFVRSRDVREAEMELFSRFPVGLLLLSTAGMALLILAVAIPLFLLMPRVTMGFYKDPSGNTQFVSGFTERVELGQTGAIRQSDAVVMKIQTSSAMPDASGGLKWRGLAFDYFDGRSWKITETRRFSVATQGRYFKLENSAQGTNWLNQTFFVEALSTDVVFAAGRALAVSLDVGRLQRDSAGNLYTDSHIRRKLRYAAISDPIRPDSANISDLLPIPREILDRYLQVPQGDPRVSNLARRVTQNANGRFSKAKALEQYLRLNYGYSLVLRGTPNGADPLATFLFDVRAGHCEYFASAMTIMLRQLGIPARLVNGFRAGEYNSIGDNWTVRQYHAHSWVEAYFPPYGWIEFDPTPVDPGQTRTGFVRLISDLTDAIDLWWWEGVLNYDSSKQYRVMNALQAALEKSRQTATGFFKCAYEIGSAALTWESARNMASGFSHWWIVCAALVLLSVSMLAPRWRRRFLGNVERAWHRDSPKSVAVSFFNEAMALLGDHGLKLEQGQTAMEFARSLKGMPPGDPFLALAGMYYSVRFGPPDMPFDRAEAQLQLRLLRDSLRTR